MKTQDLGGLWFRRPVLFTPCVGSTVLTARLVDEWEDDSDDDRHEHEEPEIHIHTLILGLATDGRQRSDILSAR